MESFKRTKEDLNEQRESPIHTEILHYRRNKAWHSRCIAFTLPLFVHIEPSNGTVHIIMLRFEWFFLFVCFVLFFLFCFFFTAFSTVNLNMCPPTVCNHMDAG